MNTNIEIIKGVRCYVDKDNVAQLNLEDVARGLGFVDNSKTKEYVRWNTVRTYLEGFDFSQDVAKDTFIPEPIFYLLAMKADNETARAFQHTIAYDVLPAIRRHGMYAVDQLLDDPDLAIQAFTALKEERAKRKALESELDRSKEWYSIKRVAHMNGRSHKDFDWRKLKAESEAQGYGVKKIFDANYGEVNIYHMKVWETVYPYMEI